MYYDFVIKNKFIFVFCVMYNYGLCKDQLLMDMIVLYLWYDMVLWFINVYVFFNGVVW